MVSVLRRSGSSAAALVAALLILLGVADNVVEAKKVKRVKAGTTYKTHDRKFFNKNCWPDASQSYLVGISSWTSGGEVSGGLHTTKRRPSGTKCQPNIRL